MALGDCELPVRAGYLRRPRELSLLRGEVNPPLAGSDVHPTSTRGPALLICHSASGSDLPVVLTVPIESKKVKQLEAKSRRMIARGWRVWEMGRYWSKNYNFQL